MRKQRTLYIKNPAAHRLAQKLSKKTGMTLTDAVILALEDEIGKTKRPIDRKRIDSLCGKLRALPVLDSRTPEQILGYDKFGIPH